MRIAIVAAVAALVVSAGMAWAQEKPAPPAPAGASKAPARKAAGPPRAVVLETVLGDIVIKLRPDAAPRTVANFRALVAKKFYDGTCFHRVISNYMIQGGDPNSRDRDPANDGMGGAVYTVPAEIKLKHLRGSVATARMPDQVNPSRASSGSQFFIDVAPQAGLDAGGYTVFGEVIRGMDVVDKIVAMAGDASLPAANGGGRNPGERAKIVRAYFAPLSRFAAPAAPDSAAR